MIYLDNAATTFPKPQMVVKCSMEAIRIYGGNPGRSGHKISLNTSKKVFEARANIADFFGIDTENVIFTLNCTMALNMAIKGTVTRGSHIIISDLEHNSVVRAVHKLSQRNLATYDIAYVYDDTERTVESFARLIRSNTRVLICTNASNVTGQVLPIKEIAALCKQHNIIFIVDAAQSAGVVPIDLKEQGIDILCTAGHKGLYGITGTGLMLINTEKTISTIFEGGTGSTSFDLNQPDFYPDKFESGTVNTVGILSMGAGVNFIRKVGIQKLYEHEYRMCKYVYDELSKMERVKLYTDTYEKNKYMPIVSFNLEGCSSVDVVTELDKRGYALRGGIHCSALAHKHLHTTDVGVVRLSPAYFNNMNEMRLFVKDLRQISKNI